MKRFLRLLLVLWVLFMLGAALPPGRAASQGETVVRVSPETVTLFPGETSTIDIEVDNVVRLRGFSIKIGFDPALLEVSNLVFGGFLSSSGFEMDVDINQDEGYVSYDFAIIGNDVQSGSGILFSFDITAGQAPAETDLLVVDSELVGFDMLPITHQAAHGQVRIIGLREDAYEGQVNEVLMVPAPGVLENDVLPEGVDYGAQVVDGLPDGEGTLSLDANGGFTYTPEDWTGTTGFTYRACHVNDCLGPATVTLRIEPDEQPVIRIFLPLIMRP